MYKVELFFFRYPILSSENALIKKIRDNTKNTIVNMSKVVILHHLVKLLRILYISLYVVEKRESIIYLKLN